jgi:predicted O-methyltransferase YrrM
MIAAGSGRPPDLVACHAIGAFMTRPVLVIIFLLALAPGRLFAQSPEQQQVLASIKAADKGLLAVSEEDGRFLRLMVATARAKHALEIGGASGYSAIWIGLGLRETGGRLTTIEYDPARAKAAAENIRRAGLSDIVTVVPGDAFAAIPRLAGSFDFVFLDAWKRDYRRFYDLVFPRLDLHGLFLAHNVVNKRDEMRDFLDAIQNSPRVLTTIVSPGTEGMSVTLKRP